MKEQKKQKKTKKTKNKKHLIQCDKTINDFMDVCHCMDPKWENFMMKRENESLIDFAKRITPNSDNCIFTQFKVTYRRHTNFILEP
jgi:hypothetical protein